MSAVRKPSETLLHMCGAWLTPLAEGALWWADARILVVSDLHLEKGSSFAAAGQLLPPYDTSATLTLVESLVRRLAPKMVISLGDSFHDRRAETRMSAADSARVRALTQACDWVWVEGNHDPDPPEDLGGRAERVLRIGPLVFRHEPTGEVGEISGHLHPAAKLVTRYKTLRRRCFACDGQRIVMPALGAFTGGLNVLDPAFATAFPDDPPMVFAIAGGGVSMVPRRRLIKDWPRRGASRWQLDLSLRS